MSKHFGPIWFDWPSRLGVVGESVLVIADGSLVARLIGVLADSLGNWMGALRAPVARLCRARIDPNRPAVVERCLRW